MHPYSLDDAVKDRAVSEEVLAEFMAAWEL